MGYKGFVVFNAAANQIQETANNLAAIREARLKRKEEQDLRDINKKKAELEVKAMEAKGEMTAFQLDLLKSQQKEYFKQQRIINDGDTAKINQEEHNQAQKLETAGKIAQATFPEAQDFLAQTIGPGGRPIQGMAEREITSEAMPSVFESMPEDVLEPNAEGTGFKTGNKEEYAMKRINALKSSGTALTPDEEFFVYNNKLKNQGMRYNKSDVIRTARQMAIDSSEKDKLGRPKLTAQSIKDMLPEAEKSLYGESSPIYNPRKSPIYNSPRSNARYNPNKNSTKEITVKSPDGKLYTLPSSQWDEARKQGFKRVE